MIGQPNGFWAKLRKDSLGEVIAWHPLNDHCADVAACCEALLTRTVLGRRMAFLAGRQELGEVMTQRLCVLAVLHDLGKVNLGFQAKSQAKPYRVAGHVREVVGLIASGFIETEAALFHAINVDSMMGWSSDAGGESLLSCMVAAFCHHGKPYQLGVGLDDPWMWARDGDLDPMKGAALLSKSARAWFPVAFEEHPGEELPNSTPFQHAFSGLVMLADWIGSDVRFFPYSQRNEGDRLTFARKQAELALDKIGLDPFKVRESLGEEKPGFKLVSPFLPYPLQSLICSLPTSRGPRLEIIESETGSGKTEAAFIRFLSLFHAGDVDGIYFALPTRSAATQLYDRATEMVSRAFPFQESRPPVVLAVPGYLSVDGISGQHLPGFKVLWNDERRVGYRGWAAEHPKRFLAGAVVIGTIDQVLLSTLQVGHAHLRATASLRHLLVIDEVHASDAYMGHLTKILLDRHLAAGGSALLMSATLGEVLRSELVPSTHQEEPLSLKKSIAVPYPLVSVCDGPSKMELKRPKASLIDGSPQKSVRVEISRDINSEMLIAARALTAAALGARVLIIRNLVSDCLSTQRALVRLANGRHDLLFTCADEVAPHHSRFAREDRKALDQAVEAHFGKGSLAPCVLVATQTVQQSLDIDVDLLITDICPLDVLLQRIGRLHRHQRDHRPHGFSDPHVVVLTPKNRDLGRCIGSNGKAWGPHGIGSVYDDLRIIESTWRELERRKVIVIPEMNRELVELTTHPEALQDLVNWRGGRWTGHHEHMKSRFRSESFAASLCVLQQDKSFGDFSFSSDAAQTRLGEGNRSVALPRGTVGPFGLAIKRLPIPFHLLRKTTAEDEPRDVVSEGGVVTFRLGATEFIYDRMGLRIAD